MKYFTVKFRVGIVILLSTYVILLSYKLAAAYSGLQHQRLSNATYDAFVVSGYNELLAILQTPLPNDRTYFQQIVDYVNEPDSLPLDDDIVNLYSDYTIDHPNVGSYNFKALVNAKIQEYTLGLISYDQAKNFLASWDIEGASGDPETALKSATQHTFVRFPGDMRSESFEPLTIAPWAAQAEYRLAVSLWPTDKEEALRRLGRTLHYIQDITVPHHAELAGNFPDLEKAFCSGSLSGVNAHSHASQTKYESDDISNYQWTSSQLRLNNNLSCTDVKQRIIETQRIVRQNYQTGEHFMNYVDGKPQYETWIYNFIQPRTICEFVQFPLYGDIYPKYAGVQNCRNFRHPFTGVTYYTCKVGKNDDAFRVLDALVPLAIKNSAMVIAQFFLVDVSVDPRRCTPDLTPMLQLLLLSPVAPH